jgi:hypothetical protein
MNELQMSLNAVEIEKAKNTVIEAKELIENGCFMIYLSQKYYNLEISNYNRMLILPPDADIIREKAIRDKAFWSKIRLTLEKIADEMGKSAISRLNQAVSDCDLIFLGSVRENIKSYPEGTHLVMLCDAESLNENMINEKIKEIKEELDVMGYFPLSPSDKIALLNSQNLIKKCIATAQERDGDLTMPWLCRLWRIGIRDWMFFSILAMFSFISAIILVYFALAVKEILFP